MKSKNQILGTAILTIVRCQLTRVLNSFSESHRTTCICFHHFQETACNKSIKEINVRNTRYVEFLNFLKLGKQNDEPIPSVMAERARDGRIENKNRCFIVIVDLLQMVGCMSR